MCGSPPLLPAWRWLIRPPSFAAHVVQVLLLGLLSFVVFYLERADLSSRLGIVVTLFLAMAAVQFVMTEN